MSFHNLKFNFTSFLLAGLLATSIGCGETPKSKKNPDYDEKQKAIIAHLQGLPDGAAVIELIKKLGDSTVSAKDLDTFIKTLDENTEPKDFNLENIGSGVGRNKNPNNQSRESFNQNESSNQESEGFQQQDSEEDEYPYKEDEQGNNENLNRTPVQQDVAQKEKK